MRPLALIIRAAGTNCDQELAYAFEQAGAHCQIVHLNHLIHEPKRIDEARLIGFPGGFSYGDDIAAGRIFARRIAHHLLEPLRAAVTRGVPIIGICNGFQVLVQCGLLPDPAPIDPASNNQTVALANNDSQRFIDRWVGLHVPVDTVCIWTRGLNELALPIAHGEGRVVAASDQVTTDLKDRHQIALRYDSNCGDNPNGSVDYVAGICDPSGVVLGLMPHPERYIHPSHHPQWPRQTAQRPMESPAGLRMFENAVVYACSEASNVVI